MKALQWFGRRDLRIVDVAPPPDPGPGEVQVRVHWCGICGTDLEEWRNGPIFIPRGSDDFRPITLGHEVAGSVVSVGPSVMHLKVGQRVAVDGLTSCGACAACLRGAAVLCPDLSSIGLMADGGLAEFVNVPAKGAVAIPDHLRSDEATFAEPLAVGVRALQRGGITPGMSVCVMGAGAVGILAAQAANAYGASGVTIVDPQQARLDVARMVGIQRTLAPTEVGDDVFDLVLECSGNSLAIALAVKVLNTAGTLVLVGLSTTPVPLELLLVVTGEKTITGSLSHLFDSDFPEAVRLLAEGTVVARPLISSRVSLDQAMDAFARLEKNSPQDLKVLVGEGELSQ